MREKYESLSVAVLRDLAKARGLKGISALKKAELVEAMLAEDERLAKEDAAKAEEKEVSTDAKPATGKKNRSAHADADQRTKPVKKDAGTST